MLKAESQLAINETQSEYYAVVKKYNEDLEAKLKKSFNQIMPSERYHIKIISDVSYDVTLDKYNANKLILFANFKNASTEELQNFRIMYKKIINFNHKRGDEIYFYNLPVQTFDKIVELRRLIRQEEVGAQKNQTIHLQNF